MSPETSGRFDGPDFSNGQAFLVDLGKSLHRRQRRRTFAVSVLGTVGAVLLFFFSYSALQEQAKRSLWETYLLSQAEEVVDVEQYQDLEWMLYVESLLQEEDLDLLMEELLQFSEGESWIQMTKVEG